MGIANSNTNEDKNKLKPKSISQIIDYVATHYILTMDFKSLTKMYDKEYCDKLVILTSEIIDRNFTDMEITYLAQRVKNGVEVNETEKDKFMFFDKDELQKLDIQNSIKKKRVCIGISKFYIKIAHIFAAIVMTINPVYVYKDVDGSTVKASLNEKGKIPKNVPRDIYKLNICDNRINSLQNTTAKSVVEEPVPVVEQNAGGIFNNDDITINPTVCSINRNDKGELKTLIEEPGIQELEELYFDDKYDFTTGKFTAMSDATRKVYNEDLQIFNGIFSDNNPEQIPPSKFSDIKLKDYGKSANCIGDNPKYKTPVKGKLSNYLFAKYAENLKQMIRKTNTNQTALIEVLNQLFVYSVNPQTNKKQIRVSPDLTEDKIQEIVIETRARIIKLYLTCEVDYTKGINIYEAIVDNQILETAKNQTINLANLEEKLVNESVVPMPAEVKQLEQRMNVTIAEQKQDVVDAQELINKEQQEKQSAIENISQNPVITDIDVPKT